MRNDFDDDVSTTNDALSVVCGWSVFFYALSLSLSLCVCVCVYVVNIYITTTIRVPSFPLRSFPKGSGASNQSVARRTPRKSQIRVYELSCVSRFSLSLSGLVVLLLFRRCFLSLAFWTFFFPEELRNVVKVSFSFSRVLSWFFLHTHSICAQRRQTDTLRAERKRERVFGGRRRVFERETR